MLWGELKADSIDEMVSAIISERMRPDKPLTAITLTFGSDAEDQEVIVVENLSPSLTNYIYCPEEMVKGAI